MSVGNKFDLTDVDMVLDSARSVHELALEVLQEYAPNWGDSRIERLARWVVETVDVNYFDECQKFIELRDGVVYLKILGEDEDDSEGVVIEFDADRALQLASALLLVCGSSPTAN